LMLQLARKKVNFSSLFNSNHPSPMQTAASTSAIWTLVWVNLTNLSAKPRPTTRSEARSISRKRKKKGPRHLSNLSHHTSRGRWAPLSPTSTTCSASHQSKLQNPACRLRWQRTTALTNSSPHHSSRPFRQRLDHSGPRLITRCPPTCRMMTMASCRVELTCERVT